MVRNVFVLQKGVLGVIIEKLPFRITHVSILDSVECGNSKNDCYRDNASKYIYKVK